jgi:hypothetical protein
MTNFTNNSESCTARSGLYRVWVPLRDDGRVPLVSIWIDSTMAAFEVRPQQEDIGLPETKEGPTADECEGPDRCVADAAMAVEFIPKAIQWTNQASAWVSRPCENALRTWRQ